MLWLSETVRMKLRTPRASSAPGSSPPRNFSNSFPRVVQDLETRDDSGHSRANPAAFQKACDRLLMSPEINVARNRVFL